MKENPNEWKKCKMNWADMELCKWNQAKQSKLKSMNKMYMVRLLFLIQEICIALTVSDSFIVLICFICQIQDFKQCDLLKKIVFKPSKEIIYRFVKKKLMLQK